MSSVPASSKRGRPTPWVHYLQNAVVYLAVVVLFGPIFWLIITGFKEDAAAYVLPPQIFFTPTLEQYASALQDFWAPFFNSLFIVGVSTIICLAARHPGGVRAQLLLQPAQREHRVLVHHHQGAAAGRGA